MFSGRERGSICICARLSIWKTPVVSAALIRRKTSSSSSGTREIDALAPHTADLGHRAPDGRQHPEPEQVDLEEAGIRAGVLVPLRDLPPLHRPRARPGRARSTASSRAPCRRDAGMGAARQPVGLSIRRASSDPARRGGPLEADRLRDLRVDPVLGSIGSLPPSRDDRASSASRPVRVCRARSSRRG